MWAAVIPAYNAAGTIRDVIEGVSAQIPLNRILVVDDGSTDETGYAVRNSGAQLLRREINGGKGRALQDGFQKVLEWNSDWTICLDADGQHDPAVIPNFQEAARGGLYDLIIGNRRNNLSGMPLFRRFSNFSSSYLLTLRTGIQMPDVQCGYRAIKTDILRHLDLKAISYDIEVEMIENSLIAEADL